MKDATTPKNFRTIATEIIDLGGQITLPFYPGRDLPGTKVEFRRQRLYELIVEALKEAHREKIEE